MGNPKPERFAAHLDPIFVSGLDLLFSLLWLPTKPDERQTLSAVVWLSGSGM